MSEEIKEEEKPVEEKPRRTEEFDIMSLFKGGGMEELDPMTRWLLVQEMLDDWRERREEKRGRKQMTPEAIAAAVVKALNDAGITSKKGSGLDELLEKWEKRFTEYQTNIEKLLLGKKAEEAEEKAERLEKELKEIKEKIEQEKLLTEKIQEAITPYKEQISQLQQLLAEKTKGMSENEKRTFFQSLGEQIEQTLSSEVSTTIAKRVAEAITSAFTPKEEEIPVTKEGKVDTYKMIDKWVREGLKTVQTLAQRWPQGKPPPKEVQKIPITTVTHPETPPTTPPETPIVISKPEVTVSIAETPKEPEAKTEIPEQPKQEAKPETEEKPAARTKPRKHRETTEESPQKQEP
jgi:peptidyl-tRNA hydrolase